MLWLGRFWRLGIEVQNFLCNFYTTSSKVFLLDPFLLRGISRYLKFNSIDRSLKNLMIWRHNSGNLQIHHLSRQLLVKYSYTLFALSWVSFTKIIRSSANSKWLNCLNLKQPLPKLKPLIILLSNFTFQKKPRKNLIT